VRGECEKWERFSKKFLTWRLLGVGRNDGTLEEKTKKNPSLFRGNPRDWAHRRTGIKKKKRREV